MYTEYFVPLLSSLEKVTEFLVTWQFLILATRSEKISMRCHCMLQYRWSRYREWQGREQLYPVIYNPVNQTTPSPWCSGSKRTAASLSTGKPSLLFTRDIVRFSEPLFTIFPSIRSLLSLPFAMCREYDTRISDDSVLPNLYQSQIIPQSLFL